MTDGQRKLHDQIILLGGAYSRQTDAVEAMTLTGWALFNTNTPLTCGIERIDEAGVFDGDQEAVIHVCHLAIGGNRLAAQALALHLLANEYRGMVWGDAYINTRLGPG